MWLAIRYRRLQALVATHDPEAAPQLDAELRLDDGVVSWPRPPAWST